tara:strand:+ start:1789 stop:2277 length:489 start_codon:yes stop_codon:yes gene_type:complete
MYKDDLIIIEEQPYTSIKDYVLGIISLYKYFTFWILTLNILYLLGYLKKFYSSILFLNIIVLVGTTIILIKYKWRFETIIHKKKVIIKDNLYRLVHFFAHYFFFILLLNKGGIKSKGLLLGILLPILYLIFFDTYHLYKIKRYLSGIIFIILVFVYTLIYNL